MTGERFAVPAATRKEQRQIPGYGKCCACVVTDQAGLAGNKTLSMITKLFSRVKGFRAMRAWSARASRPGDVTLPVANYRQLDGYSCAAVSGFAVVKTFLPDADFGKFYDFVDPDPETGTSDWRLIKSLRKFGVRCG